MLAASEVACLIRDFISGQLSGLPTALLTATTVALNASARSMTRLLRITACDVGPRADTVAVQCSAIRDRVSTLILTFPGRDSDCRVASLTSCWESQTNCRVAETRSSFDLSTLSPLLCSSGIEDRSFSIRSFKTGSRFSKRKSPRLSLKPFGFC